jgi:hypothetical protein
MWQQDPACSAGDSLREFLRFVDHLEFPVFAEAEAGVFERTSDETHTTMERAFGVVNVLVVRRNVPPILQPDTSRFR